MLIMDGNYDRPFFTKCVGVDKRAPDLIRRRHCVQKKTDHSTATNVYHKSHHIPSLTKIYPEVITFLKRKTSTKVTNS